MMMAVDENLKDRHSCCNPSWGKHECLYQMSGQSTQWLLWNLKVTDWQTPADIPRGSLLVWIKIHEQCVFPSTLEKPQYTVCVYFLYNVASASPGWGARRERREKGSSMSDLKMSQLLRTFFWSFSCRCPCLWDNTAGDYPEDNEDVSNMRKTQNWKNPKRRQISQH